jgi:hypothetical protein
MPPMSCAFIGRHKCYCQVLTVSSVTAPAGGEVGRPSVTVQRKANGITVRRGGNADVLHCGLGAALSR